MNVSEVLRGAIRTARKRLVDARNRQSSVPVSTRREALGYVGGAGLGLGVARALDNVVLGYGTVMGTNLRNQELGRYATEGLAPRDTTMELAGDRLELDDDRLIVQQSGETLLDAERGAITRASALAVDDELDVADSPVTQLVEDLPAVETGALGFEFGDIEWFFDRLEGTTTRPYTVEAVRGTPTGAADPSLVESFADASPRRPQTLLYGLVEGFREHSSYDIPRYAAGSVEDNVLQGRVDLRKHFESPATYEALVADENSGLFCSELTRRAIEGFHASPAFEQTPPVVSAYVHDRRHKHAYLGLASLFREAGELTLGMTFVDYMHSTLYDDLRLTGVLGDGIDAYGDRHRATDVYWVL